MQRVIDVTTEKYGEVDSLYQLMEAFLFVGQYPQVRYVNWLKPKAGRVLPCMTSTGFWDFCPLPLCVKSILLVCKFAVVFSSPSLLLWGCQKPLKGESSQ